MQKKTMEQLEVDLKQISAGKILDIATGSGEFLSLLIHHLGSYDSITAIDSNDRSFEAAGKHFKDKAVKFKKVDAYEMDFPTESFDTVSISNSLHHFADIEAVLLKMKQVLKKNGTFIINEMHCDDAQSEEQKTHVKMHHWWGKIDSRLNTVHNKTYTSKQIEKMISKLNLSEVRMYEYAYPMPDPKDKEMIEKYITYFDPYVDRLKDHEDYAVLKEEGEEIKLRLREIGFAPATTLFVIGTK